MANNSQFSQPIKTTVNIEKYTISSTHVFKKHVNGYYIKLLAGYTIQNYSLYTITALTYLIQHNFRIKLK